MSPLPEGKRLPIRVLLARLVVLGLIPVALLSAWAIVDAVRDQQASTERAVLELSRALASAVDADLEATRQSLATMGRSELLAAGDLRGFYDAARREAQAHPEWTAVVLTDAHGAMAFNTLLPFGGGDGRIIDQASLQRTIRTGRPTVGAMLPGRSLPAFAVRIPVFADGQLAWVLSAAVRPDHMLQVLVRQHEPKHWVIAVFDNARMRVARSNGQTSSVGGHATADLAALFDRYPDRGVGVTTTLEGESVYTGFTRLEPDGWIVAVGAPTSELRSTLMNSVAWHVAGVLGSLLACFLLGRRIVRRIGKDVARLRDDAVGLSAGDVIAASGSPIVELDEMARALSAASHRLHENARTAREALVAAGAAAAAKDQFLAVLGHELRNPLAPMLTALQMVDLRHPDIAVRERRIMRRQIDHMRRLVDDLLDVSRITRGKFEIRREPVLLQEVLERSLETIAPAANAARPPIEVDAPLAPVWVQGDETRLVQAVSNLLSNAMRYGGDGRIWLALEMPDGVARVVVQDEGSGMDAETLARAFDPFYQAPQNSARKLGGLGLGLAIVQSIVSLHGGVVVASSAGPGRGSRFVIDLPTIPAPTDTSPPEIAQAHRRTGKVAIVDDNVDALEMVAGALRTAGHEVEAFAHPREALARIPAFKPDVAILDLGMPDMNGLELAAALRAAGWAGRLVALTGYGQESDKRRSGDAGFVLHLTKPMDIVTLLASVESLVRPS